VLHSSALSEKIAAGAVRVVENIAVPEAKTRRFAALLTALGVRGPALVVTDGIDGDTARASRNIANVELVDARNVHTYQILRYPEMVATRAAMAVLERRLGARGENSAS
jgi:large subunit ribosomal protein L4